MTRLESATQREQVELVGKRIHFVGIGGCGMSGLARMVQRQAAACTGSDVATSTVVDRLRRDGVSIELEQTAQTVPDPCDLVVISAAISADHPEVAEARRRGVPVLKYAQLLGMLMLNRTGVAVAGTHGKSTTTSMLSHILIRAALDPSFIVGAHCPQIGGGARCGQSDLLVAEACEYDRSFHNFHPTHAVILNVEADHLDLYQSLAEIVEAFAVFARKVPSHGTLLINQETPHRLAITSGLPCTIETIGFHRSANWQLDIHLPQPSTHRPRSAARAPLNGGVPKVRLHHRGQTVAEWSNPLPGDHMAYNSAAAAITAHRLGASWHHVSDALDCFEGLDRRMQHLGHRGVDGGLITIVDDYGHHPTEIAATLQALREHYRPHRLICVFQPHQHSRTRFLLDEFAASFDQADLVIVPDIYFVRDSQKERHAVTAADLVDRLRQKNVQAMHLYPFAAIVKQLEVVSRAGDLLVTMGAGDVWKVAHEFASLSRK